METSWLTLPYLFQERPGFCCLACMLKPIAINESFIKSLVSRIITVEQVVSGTDPITADLMDQMTPNQRRSVLAACDSLMQTHGKHYATVTHPYYFQRALLPITLSNLNYKFPIGFIKRGQVLEIFQPSKESFFASNILTPLKQESIINEGNQYADIPELHYNKCIWINTTARTLTVSAPNQTQDQKFTFRYGTEELDRLFQELQVHLIQIDSVSCIIVDAITCDFPNTKYAYNPSAQRWIEFFTWMYGSISEIILVLTISYEDCKSNGIFSKKEIRTLVNSEVEPDMIGNIKCLDVSSELDQIPEKEGHINLDLFDPPWTY